MADPKQPAVVKAPYVVNFSADPVSSARIDHSTAAPGGDGHRAGHTKIQFPGQGMLTIVGPETGRPRADGKVPFWFESVEVNFRLTDFVVQISSDYAENSCTYNATLGHEVNEHIVKPTTIMNGFRDQVVNALNAVALPTAKAPRWIRADEADKVEEEYTQAVVRVVKDYRARVSSELSKAQAESDSPDNYRLVHNQCPVQDW
jgi:hypothetical protein